MKTILYLHLTQSYAEKRDKITTWSSYLHLIFIYFILIYHFFFCRFPVRLATVDKLNWGNFKIKQAIFFKRASF